MARLLKLLYLIKLVNSVIGVDDPYNYFINPPKATTDQDCYPALFIGQPLQIQWATNYPSFSIKLSKKDLSHPQTPATPGPCVFGRTDEVPNAYSFLWLPQLYDNVFQHSSSNVFFFVMNYNKSIGVNSTYFNITTQSSTRQTIPSALSPCNPVSSVATSLSVSAPSPVEDPTPSNLMSPSISVSACGSRTTQDLGPSISFATIYENRTPIATPSPINTEQSTTDIPKSSKLGLVIGLGGFAVFILLLYVAVGCRILTERKKARQALLGDQDLDSPTSSTTGLGKPDDAMNEA